MLQIDEHPQLDPAIWQAWIDKNQAQDHVRFARRVRVIGLAAVFLTVNALLWRFLG